MSFEAVWGFNPDDKANTRNPPGEKLNAADCGYSENEEREARIPLGSWAQIHELQRMFQLLILGES